ncbi:hypothetical protein JYU34_015709 [Plutella xylostella]|uniref:Reverse transcriptase domain-containing protein n=1 Tax=Plutella xylostella TaxID=51655 RepID=A0ABQ7Q4I1_PLUXY|nr:hypothetical protein JYU34_015709 [Plutella xylostella]
MLTCKLSDHHLVGIRLDTVPGENRPCENAKRNSLNNALVREKLGSVNWSELLSIECPLLLYDKLCLVFSGIYEECKIIVTQTNKRTTQPWVSKHLNQLMEQRDELFRTWKSAPNNMNNRLTYTKFRNKVNKLINAARNKFRQNEIVKCEGDFRKIWANINKWLGRNKTNLDNVIMKYLGKSDSLHNISDKFSNTFTQEINNIKHNCNKKFLDRDCYVKSSDVSFRYKKVCARQVARIIDNLQCEKAPGSDKIRVQDLKYVKFDISKILAKFINLCISNSIYPNELKRALIRPIYKQGSHMDYTNYRPIAILSVVNKIMEKVVVGQVSSFLEQHGIISDSQHGFRRGRSTATALARFTDSVNTSLNSGQQVLAVFIDFKKAFDTLDHCQLLQAMEECGISGPTNQWFRNYLTDRTLRTAVGGAVGSEVRVDLGVPTGSVYGPVGYIMHVNSVPNVVKKCNVFMYADDMCLLLSGRDLDTIQNNMQTDFDMITKWAHDNGIILNINKTKCMHIYSPYNKKAKASKSVNIIGHTYECLHADYQNCQCKKLETVNQFKYLGLLIDSNFNWKPHINEICNRLRSVLGKFYHLSKILNRRTLYIVYHALADTMFSYGLSCYGLTFKTYLDKIKQLQIRLIKYLADKKTKDSCDGDYDKLFASCRILPVHCKVKYLIAIETYYSDDHKTLVNHRYVTRSANNRKFIQPKANNYYGQRTRRYLTPKICNNIPLLRSTDKFCKTTLKLKLKNIFLNSET